MWLLAWVAPEPGPKHGLVAHPTAEGMALSVLGGEPVALGSGLDEWWRAEPEGYEQGWVLRECDRIVLPPTDAVVTGRVTAVIRGAGGERIDASGLAAWDASGRPLDARFELAGGHLAIRVDTSGATRPIHVDPLYTTPITVLEGEAYGYGWSISGAGDVDGDGFADVLVAAHDERRVDLYPGGPDRAPASLAMDPDETEPWVEVAAAGDVNADGFGDVLVGVYWMDLPGTVWVFFGSPSGLSSDSAAMPSGVEDGDGFGQALAAAG